MIDEESWPPRKLIEVSLTTKRITSLFALGYRRCDLLALGVDVKPATHRSTRSCRVSTARRVREIYEAIGDKPGPSFLTPGRARRSGFTTPAAWDDPGTLVWPEGYVADEPAEPVEIDEVAVERAMAGDPVTLTPLELEMTIFGLYARGYYPAAIEERLGLRCREAKKLISREHKRKSRSRFG